MATLTRAAIRERALRAADLQAGSIVATTTVNYIIDEVIAEYHDLFIRIDGISSAFGTYEESAVTSSITVPSDFVAIYGLYHKAAADATELYRIEELGPKKRAGAEVNTTQFTAVLEYHTQSVALTSDLDTWSYAPGGDKFVIHQVAADLLGPRELDNAWNLSKVAAAQARIETNSGRDYSGVNFPDDRYDRKQNLFYRLEGDSIKFYQRG